VKLHKSDSIAYRLGLRLRNMQATMQPLLKNNRDYIINCCLLIGGSSSATLAYFKTGTPVLMPKN